MKWLTRNIIATNIFTIITDMMIIGLPIATLWKLNCPRAQKYGKATSSTLTSSLETSKLTILPFQASC